MTFPDRQMLTNLYNATGGDGWTNNTGWKTAPLYGDGFAMPGTEGTWFGVTVDAGRVTQINLNTNHLTGTLPSSLGSLTGLLGLDLSHNSIGGAIPASLGSSVFPVGASSQLQSADRVHPDGPGGPSRPSRAVAGQ